MADNFLITGYWGEPHVTAENDRGINAAIFGTGRFVLPVGEQFKAEYIGNNTIRMYDGKLMDNGAAGGIPAGEHVDVLIANASQGMKRNDIIVFQYELDASTLIESGRFVVIQGTETDGTATDPALTQSDLLTGEATFDQMAMWRIPVSGTTISAPVKLFSISNVATTDSYKTTLPASGWGGSAPYTQTITVNGLLEADEPFVDVYLEGVADGTAILEAWGCVGRLSVSADNKVTAYCYEEKPGVDIPIILKVVR